MYAWLQPFAQWTGSKKELESHCSIHACKSQERVEYSAKTRSHNDSLIPSMTSSVVDPWGFWEQEWKGECGVWVETNRQVIFHGNKTWKKDKTNEVRVCYWKQVSCVVLYRVASFSSTNRHTLSIASDKKYATCNEWGWVVGQQVVSKEQLHLAEPWIHL